MMAGRGGRGVGVLAWLKYAGELSRMAEWGSYSRYVVSVN
jgi:hypothetical protein